MVILRGRKIKKVFGKKSNTQEVLKDIDIEIGRRICWDYGTFGLRENNPIKCLSFNR